MGAVCVSNKQNNLTLKDDQVNIKCRIVFNKEIISIYFKINQTIKEIKAKISLICNIKPREFYIKINEEAIKYENIQLKFIIKGLKLEKEKDGVEIKVISIINESQKNDLVKQKENEKEKEDNENNNDQIKSNILLSNTEKNLYDIESIDEISIKLLSTSCQIHKDEKKVLICEECAESICKVCSESTHKSHSFFMKSEISMMNKYLVSEENKVKQFLNDIQIKNNDYHQYINTFKQDVKVLISKLTKLTKEISQKEESISDNLLRQFENFPSILILNEKISKINKNIKENINNIINNDNLFIKYYQEYMNIKVNEDMKQNEIKKLSIINYEYKKIYKNFELIINDVLDYTFKQVASIKEIDFQSQLKTFHEDDVFGEDEDENENLDDKLIFHSNEKRVINTNRFKSKTDMNFENLDMNKESSVVIKPLISLTPNKNLSYNFDNLNYSSKNFNANIQLNLASNNQSQSRVGSMKNQNQIQNQKNTNKKSSINLRQLMKSPNKSISDLLKKRNTKQVSQFSINKSIHSNFFNSSPTEYVYSKQVGSSFLYVYSLKDKIISKSEINLTSVGIQKFESFHASINYNNMIFISGNGFNSKRHFFSIQKQEISFKISTYSDMISSHSFHGMLTWNEYIFVISGFNSKKIEAYSLLNSTWISFPDLPFSRTWPSSIIVPDNGLYIFGGIIVSKLYNRNQINRIDEDEKDNNVELLEDVIYIEKLSYDKLNSIINSNNTNKNDWEVLKISNKSSISLSLYSGIIYKQDLLSLFILGGKSDINNDSSVSKVYIMNLSDFSITEKEDFNLEVPDEFDGRVFIKINNEINNTIDYMEFSSTNPDRLHIYNNNDKFEFVEANENFDSICYSDISFK